ncbi:prepilin peptidase [Rubellimicrobium arenae]|uniref:prepilin peptidase n=1 Tax=Rubellimicrobium arenae TaxID=2817372 RepID=UPI001B309B15|nr:prepilin peptidase [Rubellimicrobium arenae]
MGTPPDVAIWFLLGTTPVLAWAALSDLSRLKIPNRAVLMLAGLFLIGGLMLLPLRSWTIEDWGTRWPQLIVVLLVGMALHGAGLLGAGDAKLAAVIMPFVAPLDLVLFLRLCAVVFLLAWGLHTAARWSLGPRLAPGWVSWSSGPRFPMGIALGGALISYLLMAAAG